MKNVITYDTLRNFAYSGDSICSMPIKGIVLDFSGLGAQRMYDEDTPLSKDLAQKGIILLIPYNNPWCWMNAQAIRYTDDLINVLINHYGLEKNIPIVSSGGSMGGLSALVYAKYAEHTPVACVVNCPVCDLPYHYTERPDLPRTLYSAFFYSEAGCMEDALKKASPLHLADGMPDIEYVVFHCDQDTSVNKQQHSDRFVAEMLKRHRIKYHSVPGREHCDLDEENKLLYQDYLVNAILS